MHEDQHHAMKAPMTYGGPGDDHHNEAKNNDKLSLRHTMDIETDQHHMDRVPLKGGSSDEDDEHIDYKKEYQLSVPGSVISGASIRVDRVPLLQSSVNLANSVIGIGNLGFPFLMK